MKKTLLTNAIALMAIVFSTAQVEIAPVCINLSASDQEQIFIDIEIINSGTEVEEAFWTYEPGDSYPSDWKTQICDLNLCYGWDRFMSGTSTFSANMLMPGETSIFTLKVQNNNNTFEESFPISGVSYGNLKLWRDADFTDLISETVCGPNSTADVDKSDIVIFPNPTSDRFQIKNDSNIKTVNIYDIVGKEVSSMSHNSGEVHDVSMLRAGMYIVRLFDGNGEIVKAMRLSRR